MSRYGNGTKFEYAVRDWYVKRGYTVIRAAGSHGPFDLLAFDEQGDVHLVQCKVERRKRTYVEDVSALKAVRAPGMWKKLLFVKTAYRTVQMVNAKSGGSMTFASGSFK